MGLLKLLQDFDPGFLEVGQLDFQLTLPLQQIRELFLVAVIIQRAVGELCLQRPKLTVEIIYLALQLFLPFAQRGLALPFCGASCRSCFLSSLWLALPGRVVAIRASRR